MAHGDREASGGAYQNVTHDDYDYHYNWSEAYNTDGTTMTTQTATNDVSGTENGTSTGWSSWSYGSGSGSGSGTGSSSSSSWSSSWSDSYNETVDYPGLPPGWQYGGKAGSFRVQAGSEPLATRGPHPTCAAPLAIQPG